MNRLYKLVYGCIAGVIIVILLSVVFSCKTDAGTEVTKTSLEERMMGMRIGESFRQSARFGEDERFLRVPGGWVHSMNESECFIPFPPE